MTTLGRRAFCRTALAAAASPLASAANAGFQLRHITASAMYGKLPVATVLEHVPKTGADHVDIWRRPHANQREQVEKMGRERFRRLLGKHDVSMGMATLWDDRVDEEIRFVHAMGGDQVVTGFVPEEAPERWVERMKPRIDLAASREVRLSIENHGADLDAIRRFAEAVPEAVGVALAPYHLPQDAAQLAKLIEDLGPKLFLFYAWQHGKGCMEKMPTEDLLLQMPGRGPLDFTPLVAALKTIGYRGWTEIFMHPVPRGVPILPTAERVTAEINRARRHLEACLEAI